MVVAICDDDEIDRQKTCELISQKINKRGELLELVCFDCGEDLLEQYENGYRGYDLIFMDIYMRNPNGMEVVRQIRAYDRKVAVVFLTSSQDYAVESYDVRALAYLLKPVEPKRMEDALNRFLEERYPRHKQSLLMISGNSGRRIAYDDILYIESRRMNLRIVCSGGAEYSIRKKLDDVQVELPETRFLRCNQSFLVNMDYITDAGVDFTMENGDKIPIKVRERKRIRERYFAYVLEHGWELLG